MNESRFKDMVLTEAVQRWILDDYLVTQEQIDAFPDNAEEIDLVWGFFWQSVYNKVDLGNIQVGNMKKNQQRKTQQNAKAKDEHERSEKKVEPMMMNRQMVEPRYKSFTEIWDATPSLHQLFPGEHGSLEFAKKLFKHAQWAVSLAFFEENPRFIGICLEIVSSGNEGHASKHVNASHPGVCQSVLESQMKTLAKNPFVQCVALQVIFGKS
jgi:hypothetical protein